MGCIAINGENNMERLNDIGLEIIDEDMELKADLCRKNEDNEMRFED